MSRFLYNTTLPDCQTQLTFTVGSTPAILRAYGLLPGQSIPIEMEMSGKCQIGNKPNCGVDVTLWGPVVHAGCVEQLSAAHTELILSIPGTYRLDMSGIPPTQPVAVNLVEDRSLIPHQISYTRSAEPCPPSPVSGPGGGEPCPSPALQESDTFQVTRCDANGDPVNLIYEVTRPNNLVCPPVPGGVISLRGYVTVDGVFTASTTPPAGLVACRPPSCDAVPPLGVVGAWG